MKSNRSFHHNRIINIATGSSIRHDNIHRRMFNRNRITYDRARRANILWDLRLSLATGDYPNLDLVQSNWIDTETTRSISDNIYESKIYKLCL